MKNYRTIHRFFILMVSYLVLGGLAMAYESIYPKTPAGKIEVKQIPARTTLAAAGKGDPFKSRNEAFSKLFKYIQRHEVSMTVPVEASATTNTMQFFVGEKDAKKNLMSDENVKVQTISPITVVSIGMRGAYTQKQYDEGLKKIGKWLAEHPEWQTDGESYAVYWNSPFVPGFLKSAEIHQPIRPAEKAEANAAPDPAAKPGAK